MGQITLFSTKKTLRIGGNLISLDPPCIMGILNVTPDSFSDGGELNTSGALTDRAGTMIESGAKILDIGGYSTRPGADDISPEEETERLLPAIQTIRKNFPEIIISADTFRSEVARLAVEEGADMINDISGGSLDEAMFATVAELNVPYVLMHMRGTPQTMKQHTEYNNLLDEMLNYFREKVQKLNNLGLREIIIDPGFGFAKTIDQNYYLLKNLSYFESLGLPLLVGISRKSMIFRTLGTAPGNAVNGTTVLNTEAILNGASILRVHDVTEADECITLIQKLNATI
ncbi:MAG: dihydropteroate synthase [Cyclobacteriaceae bacterium]